MSALSASAGPTRRAFEIPAVDPEWLALAVAAYLTLFGNAMAWRQVFEGRDWALPSTWLFALCLGLAVVAAQFVLIVLPLTRATAKPWLALVLVASALASHYIGTYNVYLDPSMLRSVLRTQPKEAAELLSVALLPRLLWQALLPIALLAAVPLRRSRWRRAVLRRLGVLLAAFAVGALALLAVAPDAAALVRNHREWRYQVTPANLLYSVVRVARVAAAGAARPRIPIGTDAHLGPAWDAPRKPVLLVLVVGETARAANWGLSGYERQTTPELARLPVLNFTQVRSCGTDTETSLPCMFAPVGRRDYDEPRIRGQQGLLHVLRNAGFETLWRDNQTGCKGVCDGLPSEQLDGLTTAGLCAEGRCHDEILLDGLERQLASTRPANRAIVLHMLGSHGPAYFKRYPQAYARYQPACETDELQRCTRQQITNSYDNSLLYTDHVLAQTIALLQRHAADYDSAMLYVSDHGESLGEHGLYLHGVPYPIAPDQQTRVPMVWWLSPGIARSAGVDVACLRQRADQPAAHDHLFHSVLGLLGVSTTVHDDRYDLLQPCERVALAR